MATSPYEVLEDGTAVDIKAYRAAVLADPVRRARLSLDPTSLRIVQSGTDEELQALIRKANDAYRAHLENLAKHRGERSMEAQRASAIVPRDTVQVYEELREAGLEYGPSFRLLRNIHVPYRQQEEN